MSLNWVMLSANESFTPLAGERRLAQSPPRISFSLQSLNKYPGKEPFSVSSSSGTLYLTNRRIIYLPDSSTPQFQSFAAPLLNLHDTHVTAPWFGPNAIVALVQPVLSGGIPAHLAAVEIKLTFKDGGAYDFHSKFVQIKEQVSHAVQLAREQQTSTGQDTTRPDGVNWEAVHLEQLPAYEESTESNYSTAVPASAALDTRGLAPTATSTALSDDSPRILQPRAIRQPLSQPPVLAIPSQPLPSTQNGTHSPNEPPPGYEETQRDTVAEHLERSIRLSEDA